MRIIITSETVHDNDNKSVNYANIIRVDTKLKRQNRLTN